MNTHKSTSSKKRFIRIAFILGMVFVCALFFAWYLFMAQPANKHQISDYGFEISPPIPFSLLPLKNEMGVTLPSMQWQYKWVLLYVTPLPCDDVCHATLAKINQVYKTYLTLHKQPLDILLATFPSEHGHNLELLLGRNYPSFLHVYVKKDDFKRTFSHVASTRSAIFAGMLYIVNPAGDVVQNYNTDASPAEIDRGLALLLQPCKNQS